MLGLDTEHVDNQNLCCGANNGLFLNLPFIGSAGALNSEGYNFLVCMPKVFALLIIGCIIPKLSIQMHNLREAFHGRSK